MFQKHCRLVINNASNDDSSYVEPEDESKSLIPVNEETC